MVPEQAPERSGTDERFKFITGARDGKPRETGITFIQAEGPFYAVLDTDHLRSLLAHAGPWIDWYKFTVAANAFQPAALVEDKLRLLGADGIEAFPGGNFLEEAVERGIEDQFFDAMQDLGMHRIEVSTNAVDLSTKEKADLIEQAAERGFEVHGEIGRKTSLDEEMLGIDRVLQEMKACLEAGADKVVLESDQFEAAYSGSDDGTTIDLINTIDDTVGTSQVVFEVPLTQELVVMQACAWLIDTIGPEVNLGNVTPNYINRVEQMRRGIDPRISH